MTRLKISVLCVLMFCVFLVKERTEAQEPAIANATKIEPKSALTLLGPSPVYTGMDSANAARFNLARLSAVSNAWKQEKILVQQTGMGTRSWTAAEKQELLSTGKVKGFEGHHINNASTHPELAGDPDNIKFVKGRQEHLLEHGGSFRNATSGRPISRQKMIKNYRWSVSNQNLFIGGAQLVGGGVLIWQFLPDTLASSEIYLRGGQQDRRLLLEMVDSSLLVGAGVASSISGTARIAAYAVGKTGLSQLHRLLGPLRMTSRVAGPVVVVLLGAEIGVYTYRWNRGYISTPTFVRRMSVASMGAAGAITGGTAGAAVGEKIDGKLGGLIGGVIGTIGGGIVGGVAATDIVEEHYAEIDQVQQEAFLNHLYSFYGQQREYTTSIFE